MKSASHQLARDRFSNRTLADKYPSEYSDRRRDRRERLCILECLKSIPAGSRVLDMPCGTGRLTRILLEHGFRVRGADISPAMLDHARQNYSNYRREQPGAPDVEFDIRDVLATGFHDDEFDAVTCIRLFHHFAEAQTRQAALSELRRICRGPIIVTFLNSFALDRVTSGLKAFLRGRKQTSQRPIPYQTFAADITAAKLTIRKSIAAHWGVSSRWFLVLERQ